MGDRTGKKPKSKAKFAKILFATIGILYRESVKWALRYLENKGKQEIAHTRKLYIKNQIRARQRADEKIKRLDEQAERARSFYIQECQIQIQMFQAETDRINTVNNLLINSKATGHSITNQEFKKQLNLSKLELYDSTMSKETLKRKIVSTEPNSKQPNLTHKS